MSDYCCLLLLLLAPPPDDERSVYLIEIKGLDGGDYFYAGESIENVRIYVKEFVVRSEFSEEETEETVLSSSRVSDGKLDVKIVCRDQSLFDKTIDINSDGSEIPAVEIKEDADSQDCTLTVNYSSGESDGKTSVVAFSIDSVGEDGKPCSDNTDSYIVGRGHKICFNKTVQLNNKCQGVRLMSYRYDHNGFRQLVSGNPDHHDDDSRIVIIAESVPTDCRLTVDDKDYPIKMPSSLPNLTSKITKVGYDANNELTIDSEEGTKLFVSNGGKGYYRHDEDNKSIYPTQTLAWSLSLAPHSHQKL